MTCKFVAPHQFYTKYKVRPINLGTIPEQDPSYRDVECIARVVGGIL